MSISNINNENYQQADAASGSIVLDNVQSTSDTVTSSPFSVTLSNFTVGSGTNKVLIVGIESSSETVSGVTYGGVALTRVVSKSNTVNTEFWILKNPTSGSAGIVVSMSGSSTVIVGAYSFFGVDQINTTPTNATNSDIANNPSITIINNNAFSWVLDSVVVASTTLTNPTQTSRWNIQVIGVGDGASSSATTVQPNSSTTFGWTLGAVGSWAQIAIEVKAAEITEPLSDSLGITDSMTTSVSKFISLSDSLGITDSMTTSGSKSISLSDSLGVTDSVTASKFISLSDSLGITDSMTTSGSKSISLADSLGVTDSVTASKFISLSDSLGITDSMTTSGSKSISLSDSLGVTDSVTASKFISLSDSLGITDSMTTSGSKSISLSDSLGVTDSVTASKFISLSDSLGITDSMTTSGSKSISLSDSLGVTDSVTASKFISLSDSLGITDSMTTSGSKSISLSDSLGVTDSVTASKFISLSDSLGITDSMTTSGSKSISLSDSLGVTDSVTASKFISLSDSLGITDSMTTSGSKSISLADSLGVTDSVTASKFISLSDSLGITDSMTTSGSKSISLSDSLGVTDSVTASKFISLSDSLGITDSMTTSGSKSISLSDSLGVTDSVTASKFISLSDSLGIVDSISISNSVINTPSPITRTGGGGGNTEPPSVNGYAFSETEYPFSLDGKGYKLTSYVNSIPTTIFETGKPIEINLLLFSNSGQASIQHVSLYTNLHGLYSDNFQSDTFVTYEKNKPIEVVDPHNFFSNVSVDAIPVDNKLLVKFNVTFAKPMDTSPINLRVWDIYRNSVDTKILDAWQIIQPALMVNPELTIQQNSTSSQNEIVDTMSSIKKWGGYSSVSISDSQLLEDLGMHGTHIPSWFMKTTKWVVSNEINEQDFLNALRYLYDKGIVR